MLEGVTLGLVGLAFTLVLIVLHVPIGVALGIGGIVGFALLAGWPAALSLAGTEPVSTIQNLDLAVIPLFLLMGELAARGGLATDLYTAAHAVLGHRRGGLALATIGGCAAFGSVCGSGIATAATFGRIALPEMERHGYEPGFAAGTVAAGGTLGIMIPPSVIMVIYAALTEQFISELFVAAIIPGIMAVAGYALAAIIAVSLKPSIAPQAEPMPWSERLRAVTRAWGVVFLAVLVIGGIYGGLFTPNEAAAVGVVVALAFAVGRRKLNLTNLAETLMNAAGSTAMVYVLIIGASIFSYFLTATKVPQFLVLSITSLGWPPLAIIAAILVLYIILGAVFDEVAAMVLTIPFVLPIIKTLGYDLVWWGIINVVIIEIGMICPPIGINVFVIHGMRPGGSLVAIYRGIMPFLLADFVRLGLLTTFPALTLWTLRLWKGV
jgi:C4-dicarboxylate transporter, DctM subunit